MNCASCQKWLTQKVTDYANGERIVNYASPEGKGRCDHLGLETPANFHCNEYVEGDRHIEVTATKSGSPWQHSHYGTCPDCDGVGWGCKRCAVTGKVLYYDDGFIGEEQTRLHPQEVTLGKCHQPKCILCDRDIDPVWSMCPFCGTRIDRPETVRTDTLIGFNQ